MQWAHYPRIQQSASTISNLRDGSHWGSDLSRCYLALIKLLFLFFMSLQAIRESILWHLCGSNLDWLNRCWFTRFPFSPRWLAPRSKICSCRLHPVSCTAYMTWYLLCSSFSSETKSIIRKDFDAHPPVHWTGIAGRLTIVIWRDWIFNVASYGCYMDERIIFKSDLFLLIQWEIAG